MPIVVDPVWGPKPALTLTGGSPSSLPQGSSPYIPSGRSVTMIAGGGYRTVSFDALYRSQPWVYTAATRMSEQMARLPLHAFEWLDAGGERRARTRTHPAIALLERPRPRKRGFHFRLELALSIMVHGNALVWRRRLSPGAPPFELWRLDWRRVIPRLEDGGDGPVIAWEWRGRGVPGLEYGRLLFPEDVVHIGTGAPGGELGVSPLEPLGVTLRAEDAAQKWTEAGFRNMTRFGHAIVLDPKAKSDAVVRAGLREEIEASNGGVDQAFRNVVLGGGVTDVKPLAGSSAVEAELIEQRKVNREEIAAVYGAPAPLIGILDEAKYSSMQEFHRLLYVTALAGPLALVAEGLQAGLIDDEPAWEAEGIFLEFNLGEVLKGDVKARMDAYKVAVEAGILTLNDVRRLENLEAYTDELLATSDNLADQPLIMASQVMPLRLVGHGGDEGDPTKSVATSILRLVGKSSDRALKRASSDLGRGRAAFDRDRFVRELEDDLGKAGHVGTVGRGFVEAIADRLGEELGEAKAPEDVRAIADRFAAAA